MLLISRVNKYVCCGPLCVLAFMCFFATVYTCVMEFLELRRTFSRNSSERTRVERSMADFVFRDAFCKTELWLANATICGDVTNTEFWRGRLDADGPNP